MATKPTPGASDGTYGTELNAFLDVSLDVNGKIATEALQTDSTAPSADAAVANKKYVDDQIPASNLTARAAGKFRGSDAANLGRFGVTSFARTSTGLYVITWAVAFGGVNYPVMVSAENSSTGNINARVKAQDATTTTIEVVNSSDVVLDPTAIHFVAFEIQ